MRSVNADSVVVHRRLPNRLHVQVYGDCTKCYKAAASSIRLRMHLERDCGQYSQAAVSAEGQCMHTKRKRASFGRNRTRVYN